VGSLVKQFRTSDDRPSAFRCGFRICHGALLGNQYDEKWCRPETNFPFQKKKSRVPDIYLIDISATRLSPQETL
jgi:hypothetical protein